MRDTTSAFPLVFRDERNPEHPKTIVIQGMELRDYFAAAALTGLLANSTFYRDIKDYADTKGNPEMIITSPVQTAFAMADKMLEFRTNPQTKSP